MNQSDDNQIKALNLEKGAKIKPDKGGSNRIKPDKTRGGTKSTRSEARQVTTNYHEIVTDNPSGHAKKSSNRRRWLSAQGQP
jgi:hypothetical protein